MPLPELHKERDRLTKEASKKLYDFYPETFEAGFDAAVRLMEERRVKELKEIAEKLKRAGASVPAPENKGTIESAIADGLSIGLLLVNKALAQVPELKGCGE